MAKKPPSQLISRLSAPLIRPPLGLGRLLGLGAAVEPPKMVFPAAEVVAEVDDPKGLLKAVLLLALEADAVALPRAEFPLMLQTPVPEESVAQTELAGQYVPSPQQLAPIGIHLSPHAVSEDAH